MENVWLYAIAAFTGFIAINNPFGNIPIFLGLTKHADRGSIESIKKDEDDKLISLEESFKMGSVEVKLHGKKLKGGFNLVRMTGGKMKGNWLLMKRDDETANSGKDILDTAPNSVLTDRKLEEIAKAEIVIKK